MAETFPGLIALFGSGETAASAQAVYEHVFRRLPRPVHVSVLETPAGFELNSPRVAGRVADFVREHLPNYAPKITVIPARKRGTPFSPDNPAILTPLLTADAIMFGAGSPTYTVRQLKDSLAWYMLLARHRLGAALVLASAATIAISAYALPVYEIYKVGQDLHWSEGLDFFGLCGMRLVFIPHWNNNDGGTELDTSHCFMGQERFDQLIKMLPDGLTIVGIDEHTALIFDLEASACRVMGAGGVTIVRKSSDLRFLNGQAFSLAELGACKSPSPDEGIPSHVWEQVLAAHRKSESAPTPSEEVLALVQTREAARARRDWVTADALRRQVLDLGWQINDTPQGPQLSPRPFT